MQQNSAPQPSRLRRDLGTVQSYAALVGILVGAGIFRVTGDASRLTGPSVVLGYLLLAPAIFATTVAYVVYLSTPLGQQPGGDYTHISRTFRRPLVAFLAAWLKIISYLGALALLAAVLADYFIELDNILELGVLHADHRMPLAFASLAFFFAIHCVGVRWFGRIQVLMCTVLGISILVLVVPGLPAIDPANYRPLFTQGAMGFAHSLVPLFFAYAGFEALAHAGGEVKDSTRRLPKVFVRGVALTTVIFISMSAVAFGVLPLDRLMAAEAPMAEAASVYLPTWAAAIVAVGAIMALATSLNATMIVPARLGIMLAGDGLLPAWIGRIDPRTGTPILGLLLSFVVASLLLVSGQIGFALNIAVLALLVVYCVHSAALLWLPRGNPELYSQVTSGVPRALQLAAATISVVILVTLVALQVDMDVAAIGAQDFGERFKAGNLTSLELFFPWLVLGSLLYVVGRRRAG